MAQGFFGNFFGGSPKEEPSTSPEEPPNGGGFFGWLNPPKPDERDFAQDEKARIEEHIREVDGDFRKEMKQFDITLTKDGNSAWEEIRNAARDGTLPLQNYKRDYLFSKLNRYGEQPEPTGEPESDPLRFGDQIQDMGKVGQEDFGGKVKPPAQDPMGGPIQYDREGRPTDMPMEPTMGGLGDIMGGLRDMLFPPTLPHEEEERRRREMHEEQADLSPESGLESNEEIERKNRLIDVEKTDERFEEAHGKITQEGERAWEEVRMKYLDMGGFNYANQVQALIEAHRIPEPVDCVVDVAPWDEQGWVDNCDTHGVWVRARQRPTNMTPPKFGGKPCPPYSEVPQSVEERPCDPVDAKWEWSDWRECGDDAPIGVQVRTTVLIEEAKYGGKPYEYQKETRECTMPVVEEPSIVPEPTPVSYPMDEEDPQNAIENQTPTVVDVLVETVTNLIGGGTDETPSAPVQVDGGTSQDSLLPDQTTPVAPAVTTPVATEEPAETPTTVVEEETAPEETVVETVVETITEGVTTVVEGITDIFTPETSEEPVVEDSATTQDSVLPAQDSTPDTTSETPSPASSGGGGGQTNLNVNITTETKDETETTTEEPEEGSKALLMVGGLAVLSGIGYWAYQKYA